MIAGTEGHRRDPPRAADALRGRDDTPDFLRVVRPLSSLGLTSNADGLVFDVQGPFETQAQSPAWRAGLRAGDRVDPERMRCTEVRNELCAATLALWGGVNYLLPGREVTVALLVDGDRPARTVTPRPSHGRATGCSAPSFCCSRRRASRSCSGRPGWSGYDRGR